jgi:hypothetical protein
METGHELTSDMETITSPQPEELIRYRTLFAAMLCFYAGLMLWVGAVAFFGIGVAPVMFKVLPSKDLAGALNSVILHRLNVVELVGATLTGVAFALLFPLKADKQYRIALALLVTMVVLWAAYALGLTAEMKSLRRAINSFDTPDTASLPLVERFRGLHHWYSRLVSANLLVGLGLFVWQTRFFLHLIRGIVSTNHTN